ncbi:pentatricopeptide repeat-containing protein [Prunus yedoensis var. nudiflora]|uniref:Pentatricopeptide repeat-containing protein n=1 Tax=Prunus yedoensis var. nudiflora TaxID=2094558 RepID=A0A314UAX0_PRUYE|nr:pentatricopeptide repeat-containing protein [Prunus yedoensis var. nudiflora]
MASLSTPVISLPRHPNSSPPTFSTDLRFSSHPALSLVDQCTSIKQLKQVHAQMLRTGVLLTRTPPANLSPPALSPRSRVSTMPARCLIKFRNQMSTLGTPSFALMRLAPTRLKASSYFWKCLITVLNVPINILTPLRLKRLRSSGLCRLEEVFMAWQ